MPLRLSGSAARGEHMGEHLPLPLASAAAAARGCFGNEAGALSRRALAATEGEHAHGAPGLAERRNLGCKLPHVCTVAPESDGEATACETDAEDRGDDCKREQAGARCAGDDRFELIENGWRGG